MSEPYPKSKQLARGERRHWRKIASPKQWQAIIAAKRGPCRVCVQPYRSQFHHVVPRDLGGDDVADNIVPLCDVCHGLITRRNEAIAAQMIRNLTDAEYAYAVTKAGEDVWERVYGIRYDRLPMLEAE